MARFWGEKSFLSLEYRLMFTEGGWAELEEDEAPERPTPTSAMANMLCCARCPFWMILSTFMLFG